jgi:prepilin-type processing-associated H-X9-DG protein
MKAAFFCPAYPAKNWKVALYWQFTQNLSCFAKSGDTPEPVNNRNQHYRVTSYCFLIDAQTGYPNPPLGVPKRKWIRTASEKQPSTMEFITDATISTTSSAGTASFDKITVGGVHGRCPSLYDRTNHLKGGRPEGGNVMFLDGHTQWRQFSQMEVRWCPSCATATSPGSEPYFWW